MDTCGVGISLMQKPLSGEKSILANHLKMQNSMPPSSRLLMQRGIELFMKGWKSNPENAINADETSNC